MRSVNENERIMLFYHYFRLLIHNIFVNKLMHQCNKIKYFCQVHCAAIYTQALETTSAHVVPTLKTGIQINIAFFSFERAIIINLILSIVI